MLIFSFKLQLSQTVGVLLLSLFLMLRIVLWCVCPRLWDCVFFRFSFSKSISFISNDTWKCCCRSGCHTFQAQRQTNSRKKMRWKWMRRERNRPVVEANRNRLSKHAGWMIVWVRLRNAIAFDGDIHFCLPLSCANINERKAHSTHKPNDEEKER